MLKYRQEALQPLVCSSRVNEAHVAEPFTIRCRENGPLVVMPPVGIIDHEGNEFTVPIDKEKIALCRCGHSQRKPFCDGSHKTTGFLASERAS